MNLTRLAHACVRLDSHDARLVIDPGSFSPPDAIDGADVVLVTHEHADHVVPATLRTALAARTGLQVWAPAGVVAMVTDGPLIDGALTDGALTDGAPQFGDRVHVATAGDTFEAAGFAVEVFGELHEMVHPDVPRVANVAYLIDGVVLHPGDSFTVPPRPVDVLLVPVAAPWLRLRDAVDYVRTVAPRIAVPIHDGFYSPIGLGLVDRLLGPGGIGIGAAEYRRLTDGEPMSLSSGDRRPAASPPPTGT